ncbi:MAG: hypothetical protein ACI9JL_004521 [Paracoccaceae bacterium]|jgi:hypothetical protein
MTGKNQDRGDGRDKHGRWVNTSGNPSGRPRKVQDLDLADTLNFSKKTINIKIGGEEMEVTHHEAVVHALFQTAMKGRISAQRLLLEKFEQAALSHEYIWMRYQECAEELKNNPDFVSDDTRRFMRMMEASTDRPRSETRLVAPPKRKRRTS